MKRSILVVASFIVLVAFSCGKDEPTPSGTGTPGGGGGGGCTPNMTATFNGDVFSACGSSAIFPSVGGLPATYFSIAGNSDDASGSVEYSVGIKMNTADINEITTTTYIVNNGSSVPSSQPFSVNITAKIAEGSGTLYNSLSGNLIIEEISNSHVKGKFDFIEKKAGIMGSGPDTITVENGSFDYDIIQ